MDKGGPQNAADVSETGNKVSLDDGADGVDGKV